MAGGATSASSNTVFIESGAGIEEGARTGLASLTTGVAVLLTLVVLAPLFADLPKAVLAATIIVAVLTLVDFAILKRTWAYSKADFAAVADLNAVGSG